MNQPVNLAAAANNTPCRNSNTTAWPASLILGFSNSKRGVVLNDYQPQGPLYVQKPFYPEGRALAHAYLLHPPGGMVSGDNLQLTVRAEADAQVLITTPGAGKVYRAREDRLQQRQQNRLIVHDCATMEWFPLENILFPDANARLTTDVHLHGSGRFIGWEITSLGLPANQQRFTRGELVQQLNIYRDGQLWLRERFHLHDANRSLLASPAGMAGYMINGVMMAGPVLETEASEALLDQLRRLTDDANGLTGITLTQQMLIIRHLNHCSEQTRKLFSQCWQLIRPALLKRAACLPRIWNT